MPPMSTLASRKVFSVTGVAILPARIRSRDELIDLLMDRLEEMFRIEEIGDAVERLVVDQDRAQQRLLRLDIVRGGTVERGRFVGLLAGGRISECHGVIVLTLEIVA